MQRHVLALTCLSLLACGANSLQAFPPVPPTPEDMKKILVIGTPEQPENWSGGTLDKTIAREEVPATIRWEHKNKHTLVVNNAPKNWVGPYNSVEFWIYSHQANQSRFLFHIASENSQTEGADYYSTMLTLSFKGWRRFTFHLNELNIARNPLGWDKINRVSFIASGWGNTPNPETVVNIGPIILKYSKAVEGPITSDQDFFEAMNLDTKGMEAVKEAVQKKDFHLAKKEYVKYIKARQKPLWHFDWRDFSNPKHRIKNYQNKTAENAVKNLLTSCGIAHQFGEHIDWSINPTKLKYAEWTWQLSRHPFWTALGKAYWATADEKFAKTYVRQIRSWITQNPLPSNAANGVGSRWRTIETGIRTFSSWPNSFFYFLPSPNFDDDSIIMVVKSFYEHALHLREFPTQNNWLCMEMNGLYHIGTLFPEFKEAAEWRSYASGRLYDEMNIQVYPDGAQRELAPGYHGVSLHNFLGTYNIAKLNNLPLPGDYVQRLERMYEMYLNVISPAGHIPALNDSGWGNVRRSLLQAYELFPEREDFLYAGSIGKEGKIPSYTSNFMPYAGWYTMRSGWNPMDLYLHYEVGPFGAAHQHEDKLTFTISAYGKRLITEGGVYPYDSSQWRKYVLSARAHNVVRVDGLDQNRRGGGFNEVDKPLENRWITNEFFDFGEGTYTEGFGKDRLLKVNQARSIFFVKPDKKSDAPAYWLLFDVMTPTDDLVHEYTSWFHYNTERTTKLPEFNGIITADPNSANLLIAPLTPKDLKLDVIMGQEDPEVQGWVPAKGYDCRPVATPTFIRKAAGQNLDAYIFLPVKPKQQHSIKTIQQLDKSTFVITFVDGRKDTVTVVPGKDGLLTSLKLVRETPDGNVANIAIIE